MARVPTGMVTFCFTDIESSTRLARQLADRWRDVLLRHHELLRDTWRRHDGVEVKTEGDAFFVVFVHPSDAVAAAAEAQHRLATEPWPGESPIRVRIGLHTGAADVIDDDYVGIEVHRAARVAAAAHGGQVLLSGTTADAVADGALTLHDLGRFALKDFDEGERLVELAWDGRSAPSRVPRALPIEAHNIPLIRSSMVGRDADIRSVRALCEAQRLVTVIAPGGTGKTRLSLEVGRTSATAYPHGAWAVLLAGEPPGADVVPAVARALGVGDVSGVPLHEAVIGHLRERSLLLILDNCEHVVEAAARFVTSVLGSCPDVHVLVTSRQALGVREERVWALSGLQTPEPDASTSQAVLATDAGRLFVQRAEAASPRFELSDATARAVAAICDACDGVPLALELAAASTRAVPLTTLAERITTSHRVLRGAAADDARQRTIDGLVGWSYDLLDDVQRAVFRRAAVFRGGWTLDAAEAVCAGDCVAPDDVVTALADLVDRSLVALDADDRYRMLVLVRSYAEARLADAREVDATEDRFIGHFSDWSAATWRDGVTAAAMRVFEPEVDNVRRALTLALERDVSVADALSRVALGPFLLNRGHYEELEQIFTEVAAQLEPASEPAVRSLINRATLARARNDLSRAASLAEQALAAAHAVGLTRLVTAALFERGQALRLLGDLDGAAACARAGMLSAQDDGDRAAMLELIALSGTPEEQVEAAFAAAELYEANGEPVRAAVQRITAAQNLYWTGEKDRARQVIEDALAYANEGGLPRLRMQALYVRGLQRASDGEPDQALCDLDEAVGLMESMGEAALLSNALASVVDLKLDAGRGDDAWRDIRRLADVVLTHEVVPPYGDVAVPMARVMALRGARAEAAALAASVADEADLDERDRAFVAALVPDHRGPVPSAPDAIRAAAAVLSQNL